MGRGGGLTQTIKAREKGLFLYLSVSSHACSKNVTEGLRRCSSIHLNTTLRSPIRLPTVVIMANTPNSIQWAWFSSGRKKAADDDDALYSLHKMCLGFSYYLKTSAVKIRGQTEDVPMDIVIVVFCSSYLRYYKLRLPTTRPTGEANGFSTLCKLALISHV